MTRNEAVEFLGGGSVELAAHRMGITSQSVRSWPDTIGEGSGVECRVLVVGIRLHGFQATRKRFPGALERVDTAA